MTLLVSSTRALAAETYHRLAATRQLIEANRRRLNPWWSLSGGAAADGAGSLRPSVRERLRRGVLPPPPSQMWAGHGTGMNCVICAKTIQHDDIECEFRVRVVSGLMTLWAHLPCLDVWTHESRAIVGDDAVSEEDP